MLPSNNFFFQPGDCPQLQAVIANLTSLLGCQSASSHSQEGARIPFLPSLPCYSCNLPHFSWWQLYPSDLWSKTLESLLVAFLFSHLLPKLSANPLLYLQHIHWFQLLLTFSPAACCLLPGHFRFSSELLQESPNWFTCFWPRSLQFVPYTAAKVVLFKY